MPYTINQAPDVEAAAKAGVDSLITDDPLMALQTLDTEPAKFTVEALSRKLRKVRRRGKVRVRVSSNEPVTAELTARLKRMLVGSRTVAFDKAGEQTFGLRVDRALLKGRDRVTLKLVATTRDLALNRSRLRVRETLR